jgi:hypothetical protein
MVDYGTLFNKLLLYVTSLQYVLSLGIYNCRVSFSGLNMSLCQNDLQYSIFNGSKVQRLRGELLWL